MVHGHYACIGRAHYVDYWIVDEMTHKHNSMLVDLQDRRKRKMYLSLHEMLDSIICIRTKHHSLCFASCVVSKFEASTSDYSLVEALLTTQLESGDRRKRTTTQDWHPNSWPTL